jgi:hypothetical protein
MLDAYEPAALWSATVNLFDDEELLEPSAALFRVPIEAALDRTRYMADRLLGDYAVDGSGMVRQVPIWNPALNVNARFSLSSTSLCPTHWNQDSVADAGGMVFELVPPYDGAYLINCVARVHGKISGGAHAAWPPATKPILELRSSLDGSPSLVDSTEDALGTQAAYEQWHPLALNHLCDAPLSLSMYEKWSLILKGEAGINAEASKFALGSIRAYWSRVPGTP